MERSECRFQLVQPGCNQLPIFSRANYSNHALLVLEISTFHFFAEDKAWKNIKFLQISTFQIFAEEQTYEHQVFAMRPFEFMEQNFGTQQLFLQRGNFLLLFVDLALILQWNTELGCFWKLDVSSTVGQHLKDDPQSHGLHGLPWFPLHFPTN